MENKLKLHEEELKRFREINKYSNDLLVTEQAAPPPPAPVPEDPNAVPPVGEPGDGSIPPPVEGEAPPVEGEDPLGDEMSADPEVEPSIEDDTTEEIDLTDLVNMVKDVKKGIDDSQGQDNGDLQKMDGIFSKLGELEAKLGEMDNVIARIDQLGAEVKAAAPKTPVERLEMRSLDSAPFNSKPDEFFKGKQEEMKKSGKNEYVLTKGDVEQYGKYDMMKSFNPATDSQ